MDVQRFVDMEERLDHVDSVALLDAPSKHSKHNAVAALPPGDGKQSHNALMLIAELSPTDGQTVSQAPHYLHAVTYICRRYTRQARSHGNGGKLELYRQRILVCAKNGDCGSGA